MTDAIDFAAELRGLGLRPLAWADALAEIKARLSPADFDKFSRAHQNFTGYRSDSTLARFYGTVFSLGIHNEINGFRFGRLVRVLEDLIPALSPGQRILDLGAGGGYLATLIARHRAPASLAVYDTCA